MNYKIFENKIIYTENEEVLGEIDFEKVGENLFNINHTFVDPKLRGKGIGKKLVELAKEEIEKRNGKVVASCSYANKVLKDK